METNNHLAAILTKGNLEKIDSMLESLQDRDGEDFSEYAAELASEIQFILAVSDITTTPPVSLFTHKVIKVTDCHGTRKEIMNESIGAGMPA